MQHALIAEKIVATESGSHVLLKEGLTELLRPIIRAMLVGELKFIGGMNLFKFYETLHPTPPSCT